MSTPTTPNTELEDFMIAMDSLGVIALPAQAEKVLAWHKDKIAQAERRAELKGRIAEIESCLRVYRDSDASGMQVRADLGDRLSELRTLQENQANE